MIDEHIPLSEMEERDSRAWKILERHRTERDDNSPRQSLQSRCSKPIDHPDWVWVQYTSRSGAWMSKEDARKYHLGNLNFLKALRIK